MFDMPRETWQMKPSFIYYEESDVKDILILSCTKIVKAFKITYTVSWHLVTLCDFLYCHYFIREKPHSNYITSGSNSVSCAAGSRLRAHFGRLCKAIHWSTKYQVASVRLHRTCVSLRSASSAEPVSQSFSKILRTSVCCGTAVMAHKKTLLLLISLTVANLLKNMATKKYFSIVLFIHYALLGRLWSVNKSGLNWLSNDYYIHPFDKSEHHPLRYTFITIISRPSSVSDVPSQIKIAFTLRFM